MDRDPYTTNRRLPMGRLPFWPCAVFKVRRGARRMISARGPSKLSSQLPARGRRSSPVDILGLPRKEVIQPQLPLRLPCYDFTPITGPTFDGSFPKGLG